jgi:hypothetical protein
LCQRPGTFLAGTGRGAGNGLIVPLPPFACPNLPMDCLLKTESGATDTFAALDKIAMLGACGSEDDPWGRRMEARE